MTKFIIHPAMRSAISKSLCKKNQKAPTSFFNTLTYFLKRISTLRPDLQGGGVCVGGGILKSLLRPVTPPSRRRSGRREFS